MDVILPQSSAHPLGERHHVGVAPLAEVFMSEKGGLGEQYGKRGLGDCDWRLPF